MPSVYIEARLKGRPEGSPVEDYVVEDHADHALSTHNMQQKAIDWAKTPVTQRTAPVRTPCQPHMPDVALRTRNSIHSQSAAGLF
ncbi:MAG: hypothetical protein JO289_06565 [Xanthobacteraceae bacterium]|nr:hypothetical protein [Xanthobacteraceae bacterium]